MEGAEAIGKADKVFVKTALTDTYNYFKDRGIEHTCLDFIYDNSQNFDELDSAIVEFIASQDDCNIAYCVNGSGYDDRSVMLLSDRRAAELGTVCEQKDGLDESGKVYRRRIQRQQRY
jgi:uncharacterized protein YabN with tetrapyrrole methylase and pyrophosphatase domain